VKPDVGSRRPANEIVAITAIRHLLDDAQAGPVGRGARGMNAFAVRPIARKVGGICGTASEAMRPNVSIANTMVRMNGILLWLMALSKIGTDLILKAPPGCGESAGIVIADWRYHWLAVTM
jgi:hypothetical protein